MARRRVPPLPVLSIPATRCNAMFQYFEDALAVAHMEQLGIGSIVSYDRDFYRVAGLRRGEP